MSKKKRKSRLHIFLSDVMHDNSELQQNSVQSTKKKPLWFSHFKMIFSKLPILAIVFSGLSVISIVTLLLLALSFSQDSFSSNKINQKINDFTSAKSAFENITSVPNDWFKEGIKLPDTILYVNSNKDDNGNKMFVCISNGNRNEFLFTDISNTDNAGKQIIVKDTAKFDDFIKNFLNIDESDNVDTLAKKIGANNTYIEILKKNYPLKIKTQRDVILSLIFNTIAGDPKGHIAVTIGNKKLKVITANDFVWDRIDADQFVKSMNRIVSRDTLNEKNKFILATSNKLLNNNQPDNSNNNENKLQRYFNNDKVIQLKSKLPINFLYYDFRKDVLHIGKNEFRINDEKTKQYFPRLKSLPEKVFYLVENDTSLYDLSNFNSVNDKIIWGIIDTNKLANGKFTSDDFANDYDLIKTWGKPYLIYLAIFILLLQILFSIYYWVNNLKKRSPITQLPNPEIIVPKTEDINIDEESLTEEQKTAFNILKKQIEDYKNNITEKDKENSSLNSKIAELKTQLEYALVDFQGLPATGINCVESILKAFDKVLEGNSIKEFEKVLKTEREDCIIEFKKKENFDTIKMQSDFFEKIIRSKKESELLYLLDELRRTYVNLPEIQSLKKIYNELVLEKKGQKDEIITAFLNLIDEYTKGKELLPQFKTYRMQTEEYHQIKPTFESTKKQVNDFYNLCSKLQKKDIPDFWDRTALSVWAISNLALPLLKTWKKSLWLEDKSDNITEKLKSDMLQIYTTRYFLGDFIEGKSFEDFKNALDIDIPKKIREYNINISNDSIAKLNNIDANLKNQLTEAFDKIRKFDTTQEFNNKMWDNFVKEFLKKVPNIKSDEDKAWFFEQLFNITYHTADYLDFIKNNRNIIYCFNYQFLHNNFDLSKTDHYEFQLNHIDKSTTYSNLIYKWADELKIKQLKVLIGKYMIKP